MPAVTPAEVISAPSRQKMRSGSTRAPGTCARQQRRRLPVRRRALPSSRPAAPSAKAPVQIEPKRALARRDRSQPVGERRIDHRLGQRGPAGHQRDVPRPLGLRERQVGRDAHAVRRTDRPAVRARELAVVGPVRVHEGVGLAEHVERAGDVQRLDTGKDGDDDAVHGGSDGLSANDASVAAFDVECSRDAGGCAGKLNAGDAEHGLHFNPLSMQGTRHDPDHRRHRHPRQHARPRRHRTGARHRNRPAVPPFEPRLPVRRAGRPAARPEVRPGTALYRRHVPRHRPDARAQQRDRALRGRRRQRRARLPAPPRQSPKPRSSRCGTRSRCTPRPASRSTRSR